MGKRVLILSASVGSGHVKAADALARAMRERSDVEEVLCDDSLDHTNILHKQFYSTLYKKLSEMLPEFLGWWYETSDDPWVADKSRLAIDLPQALPLISLVKEFRPDVILCTHFMPAGVISWLIANGKLEARLGVALFQRTTRRQLLTEEGEQFYHQCREALGRIREGLDTISVTGNVLRDYLTDLFLFVLHVPPQ